MLAIVKADTFSELKTIEGLAFEIWTQHYTPIIGGNQVKYMLEVYQSLKAILRQIADGYEYYLLKSNDKPVGYLAVQERLNRLFLSKFYVLTDQRGKGFGKKAHAFLLNTIKQKGLSGIDLTVNKENLAAISVYEYLGYRRTGVVVIDIGGGFVMDDYTYSYDLN